MYLFISSATSSVAFTVHEYRERLPAKLSSIVANSVSNDYPYPAICTVIPTEVVRQRQSKPGKRFLVSFRMRSADIPSRVRFDNDLQFC